MLRSYKKKNPGREGKKKGRRGVTPGIKGFGWMDRGRERWIINERGNVGKEKEEQRPMDLGERG